MAQAQYSLLASNLRLEEVGTLAHVAAKIGLSVSLRRIDREAYEMTFQQDGVVDLLAAARQMLVMQTYLQGGTPPTVDAAVADYVDQLRAGLP